MDFFEHQDQARRHTSRLVAYFGLAVALTILLIYVILAAILLRGGDGQGLSRVWHPQLFLAVSFGTSLVILIGSLVKIGSLSQGGGAVARMLGGVPVHSATSDPDERKLLNVVEEMAIASGTPVPELYVLPEENGINAFAAGFQPGQAAIGVTRGCMTLLSRDELQGVIAHEFSHILNGDMRLNLKLMGVVHGLICLTVIGRVLLHSSSRHSYHRHGFTLGARSQGKGGNPLPLIGLVLIVIGGIGVLFGRLIKSAVSRQREFLADAAAVQFTRNPDGLSGALKKIGGLSYGSLMQSSHAEEASHLFFGNGLKPAFFQAFATHPPLADRIRAIDPQFDGQFPKVAPPQPKAASQGREVEKPPRRPIKPPMLPDLLGGAAALAAGAASAPASPLLSGIGQPRANHLDYAVQLMAAMPAHLNAAIREPLGAVAMVLAMVLSPDSAMRHQQRQALRQRVEPSWLSELDRVTPVVEGLAPALRLPAVELAFPALRQLSPPQYDRFREAVREVIESDQQLDLFEFSLGKMLARHLDAHFHPVRSRGPQFHSLKPLLPDVAVLLSALAHLGHEESEAGQRAWDRGIEVLGASPSEGWLPWHACRLDRIGPSLDHLAQATPGLQKRILSAAVEVIAADGRVTVKEADLLRALADAMGCPMPPLLPEDEGRGQS